MKLLSILKTILEEKKTNLVDTNDWKVSDVEYLLDMGFDFEGNYYMATNKPPRIKIYKKKNEKNGVFYVEEEGKPIKFFTKFNGVIDYFDTYPQEEIDRQNED